MRVPTRGLREWRAYPESAVVLRACHHKPPACAGAIAHDATTGAHAHAAERIREKHDGRFETLGLVQVHQPDEIRSAGLERQRLDVTGGLEIVVQRFSGV